MEFLEIPIKLLYHFYGYNEKIRVFKTIENRRKK